LLSECASLSRISYRSSLGNIGQDIKGVKDGLRMPAKQPDAV